jgi:ABC-type multidrug transport system fused ATPase/permease subunit
MFVGRRVSVQLGSRHVLLRHCGNTTGGGSKVTHSTGGGALLSSRFPRHLARLAWPERHRLGGGLLLLIGSSSVSLVFPKVMGTVMDSCLAGSDGGWTPVGAASALLLLTGAQSVMVAARGRLLAVAGERVAARLRTETFSTLFRHNVAFFDRSRSGELQSRLISDCSSLQKLVVADAVGAIRASLMCTGSSLAMISLSPSLFAVSVLTFPAAVLVARRTGERMKAKQREVQDALAEAGAEADRALSNVRTLKLFAAEDDAIRKYTERVEEARSQAEAVGTEQAISEAGVTLALQTSILSVLAVGGQQVIDGALSYGDLSAFFLYSMMTGFSAGNVASAYAEARRASGASERVLALIEPDRSDLEDGGTRTIDAFARGGVAGGSGSRGRSAGLPITLEKLSFAYPSAPSRVVLRSLDVNIGAGERVALRGPSGCGKSTVGALLAGLYAPLEGRVMIDGIDVRELEKLHVRTRLLSVVPQEPALFTGSLRDNLAIGRPDASEEELRAAAAAAGMSDFATAHWDREVGERGLQLSGGQKQRVALARVLLRDTPIVLLDEFSSALDAELERRLRGTLRTALEGKTLILITHRSSALELVDRVIDLEPVAPHQHAYDEVYATSAPD